MLLESLPRLKGEGLRGQPIYFARGVGWLKLLLLLLIVRLPWMIVGWICFFADW